MDIISCLQNQETGASLEIYQNVAPIQGKIHQKAKIRMSPNRV